MNAPADIPPVEKESGDGWTAAEKAYRHAITIHCPNEPALAMSMRCELAAMRDQATRGVALAGDSAGVILAEISRLATFAVFAPMPASRLMRIRSALNLTMMAAREIERVTRDG